jgi:hypothetical protein
MVLFYFILIIEFLIVNTLNVRKCTVWIAQNTQIPTRPTKVHNRKNLLELCRYIVRAKTKLKQSHYSPGQALRVPAG